MTPLSPSVSPPALDRAMTPDAVVAEILNHSRSRSWVIRRVPRDCRVPHNTRPPLYWRSRVLAWWEGRKSA